MSRKPEQPIEENAQGKGLDPSGDRGPSRPRRRGRRFLEAIRTRKGPRRVLKTFTVLLLLGGIGLLSYPFATNMFANYKQGRLRREFSAPTVRQEYLTRTIPVGHALTRLRIPKLHVDTMVVEGTTLTALRAGSGHYPRTPLPCEPGNSAIAGHRTTYSKPFSQINMLRPGDKIIFDTPVGRCEYEVQRMPWSTDPYDWSVARNLFGGAYLTLTTCDPPGSAARRLIVRARLVRTNVTGLPLPPPPRAGQEQKGALPGPV
jgi:sortase A